VYLGCFRGVTRRQEEIIAMQRPLVILAVSLLAALMAGCTSMEISNPFSNDPLTGGVDTGKSQLLGVSTPAGMQKFPTHGYQTSGAGGAQGLEIFRGDADMGFVAQIMFTGLQGQGWHLRMAQRKGTRAVYVYERGSTVATLTVEREAVGTVLAIWVADRMPDGATPAHAGKHRCQRLRRQQQQQWRHWRLQRKHGRRRRHEHHPQTRFYRNLGRQQGRPAGAQPMSEVKSGLNTPFDQSTRFERKRLHLGVCGSIACYKAADLLRAWTGMGIHVSATLTPGARLL